MVPGWEMSIVAVRKVVNGREKREETEFDERYTFG